MDTSMGLVPGMQFAVPPAADRSRKVAGDGSDNSPLPRFELPESATRPDGNVASDSRASDPTSDRAKADDPKPVTVQRDKGIGSDHRTRSHRAADRKSAKSDVDEAATSANPWVQGQPATATAAESASESAGDDGSTGDGAVGDSGTSTAAVASAAAALATQVADGSSTAAALSSLSSLGGDAKQTAGDGAAVPLPAASNSDTQAPSSVLAGLVNLWSQMRSGQSQAASPLATASANDTATGAITITVTSTTPANTAVAAQSTNAATPQNASAQSVATLLQMLGGSVPDSVTAAATRGALRGTAANDTGDGQATAVSATTDRVNAAISLLLSAMSGSSKGGENRKEDSGFKDLLALMPSANTSSSAVPDLKTNALLAGIQGLAVSGHSGGGTAGSAADSASGINQPPLMLNSAGWEDSLTDRVHMLLHTTADGDVNEARIQLHPREMGSIQIHVRMGSEGADVRFAATNPDVRHALETSLPRLRELLSAGGMSLTQAQVGSQFSQTSQQAQPQAHGAPANSMTRAQAVSEDETAAPRRIRIASVSLIDDYA